MHQRQMFLKFRYNLGTMGINRINPEDWVTRYEDLNPSLKDLIEFDRGVYHHWAMYIGTWTNRTPMVVHFNPVDGERAPLGWIDGIVTLANLNDVRGSSKMRVNNLIDEHPRNWESIRHIFEQLDSKEGCRYSLTTNNCENFVTYLRFPTTSGFRSQKAGGLLSYVLPTWHIGTYDNGQIQTNQWNEYVSAAEQNRRPKHVIPSIFYM